MQTPGFWINRHPYPDRIILDPGGVERFNAEVRDRLGLVKDLARWTQGYAGDKLARQLTGHLNMLKAKPLVFIDGEKITETFWNHAQANLNLAALPETVRRQYGVITGYADQRFIPEMTGLYAQAYDEDFDETQNSALDTGTPVVVLHTSLDGQWTFVESALSEGWVRSENVALMTDGDAIRWRSAPFIVATVAKADLYLDPAMTQPYTVLRMGARLPLIREDGKVFSVLIPRRLSDGRAELIEGYVNADEAHAGYLPYTARTIYRQAFKMLYQPYGWGGMYMAQDCSRFLQEVFATVGITLPRDSKNQILTGSLTAEWTDKTPDDEKLKELLAGGVGGITVLGMKGHIMLYLGNIDDKAYAIHAVWAYRQPGSGGDDIYVLNRVTVSDLTLGEGSRRGSLIRRMNGARRIGDPQ